MLLACTGGTDPGSDLHIGPPARVEVLQGGDQTGGVGEALLHPIQIRVTDADDEPVPDVAVTFTAEPGSGTLSPITARTDANGLAAAGWTLGTGAGPQAATVAVAPLTPVRLVATSVAGPATTLAFSQAPSGAVAGSHFDPEVRVVVHDAYGNLVSTSTAAVSVILDHGILAGPAVESADAGIASFPGLHIDEPGTAFVLTAASPSLAEARSAPFDVAPGAAVTLAIVAGDGQTGVAGAPLAVAPRVAARDAAGNPVPGVAVELAVRSGGGAVAPARVVTGADGTAAPDSWTLGEAAGENRLGAAVEAAPAVAVEFFASGLPGPADASRSTVAAAPESITSGESSTIRVTARDAFGNPVAGATVRLTASGSGNTLVQPPPTDAQGLAGGLLTATGAGIRTVSAEVGGVMLALPAVVEVSALPIASVQVQPGADTLLVGQTAVLTAVVRDERGDPVEGAAVEWSSNRVGIASVDAGGVVTALKPGAATITARSGGRSGTAEVAVSFGQDTVTVPYCTMDGVVVRMDVYLPDAAVPRPVPVVVHIHGGGWVSGSRTRGVWFAEMVPAFLERGFAVASVDYRLAPEHRYPAQLQDVKCAVRHLRTSALRYGLDPAHIGVVGSSAGGQLAALLGTADPEAGIDDVGDFQGVSSRVQAVGALSPVTDFTASNELRDDYSRVFLTWPDPTSPEMIGASPVTHVSPGDSPFFFIAGEADTLVLPAQSARMHQRLLDAGATSTIVLVHNADHGLNPATGPLDPTKADLIGRLVDFFDRELR